MKKLILNLVIGTSMLLFSSCASQKEVPAPVQEETPVIIYTNDDTVESEQEVIKEEKKQEPIIHIVQKGESLWVIARKYGVTVQAIADANNIEDKSLIKINQKLIIPQKSEE